MTKAATPARAFHQRECLLPTLGYYGAILALGLAMAVLGPTLPGLASQTQSDTGAISVVFVANAVGYMLGSLLGGSGYDRRAGHRLLAAAILLMAGMLALTPWMVHLWSLGAVLLVLGVTEGIVDVGSNTLLVWVHRDRVAPWMNGLHFCFGVGSVLAPLIVGGTLSLGGEVTLAYGVLAVFIMPMAWLLHLPSPAMPIVQEQAHGEEVPCQLVFLLALFLGLYVGAELGLAGWILSYATTLKLADAAEGAYLTAAFWGAFTFGRLLGIPLATRLQPQYILLGDLIGCLVGIGIILGWPSSTPGLWLGCVVTGLSMASIFPTTFALAQCRLAITGAVASWLIVGSAAGSMVLPWLMGQLFGSLGPRALILALWIDLLAATGVVIGLLTRSARCARVG